VAGYASGSSWKESAAALGWRTAVSFQGKDRERDVLFPSSLIRRNSSSPPEEMAIHDFAIFASIFGAPKCIAGLPFLLF
jgi:hypothetical protein